MVSDTLKLLAAEILPKKKMHEHSAMLVRVKYDDFSVMQTPDIGGNRVNSSPGIKVKNVFILNSSDYLYLMLLKSNLKQNSVLCHKKCKLPV